MAPDCILDEILDDKCSKWITATDIADLPPGSEVSIELFNSVLTAFKPFETRTGIKLSTRALDGLLAKLKSLQSNACRFHEEIRHYSRSSVLYCGYCPNIVSAKYPMSLYEVCQHIQLCHRDTCWNFNMVCQSPAGQPVYDGRCAKDGCNRPLLVEHFLEEHKTGFKCKNCRRKWCSSCTVAADFTPHSTVDGAGISEQIRDSW
jgi:hypothetical protein